MTDAELAILSIVAEGPIRGYDIQTLIVQRGLRAWTNIGVSSMYYVLEKLERQGLVDSHGHPREQGASRRQYHITPAGFGVLQTAVADLISTPHDRADGFELGLANLHVLRPAQIRTAFTAYRQELGSRLHQARLRLQQFDEDSTPFNVRAMLRHQIAMVEAELAWIVTFIEEWESQAPPDEPPALQDIPEIPRMKQVVLPHDPDSPHRAPTRPLRSAAPLTDRPQTPADSSHRDETIASKSTPHLVTRQVDMAADPAASASRDAGPEAAASPLPDADSDGPNDQPADDDDDMA